jgi:hypothetical protein
MKTTNSQTPNTFPDGRPAALHSHTRPLPSSKISEPAGAEELLYVIPAPSFIANFVTRLKEHVQASLGHPFSKPTPRPCISLLKDHQPKAERFLYTAYSRITTFKPFHVSVKNLNVLRKNDRFTIYLDIVYKTPLYEVVENLSAEGTEFIPSFVIAEDLEVDDFVKVWKDLKSISFSDHFLCDHITVLKKNRHRWVHYIDIPFAA